MLRDLRSLFVSDTCYACDRTLVSQERYVCLSCLSQLQETGFHAHPTDNELYRRLGGRVPLAGATSLYFFDKGGKLQALIQALKYHDAPQLGRFLGRELGERLAQSEFATEAEVLVPVPLHPSKQRQRGYNQAERIARGMAEVLGLPLRSDLLRRSRKTEAQARRAGTARWENVSGAFTARLPLPTGLILVDDVITTGATLEACIQALMASQEPAPPLIKVASLGLARSH
jgi:ComF family protein